MRKPTSKTIRSVFALGISALLAVLTAASAPADVPRPRQGQQSVVPAFWQNVPGAERLKARRAAELDAMRALVERIYGLQLEAESALQDFALESDRIRTRLSALLQGAKETQPAVYTEDGTVQVVLGVTLREIVETLKVESGGAGTTVNYEVAGNDRVIEALGMGSIAGSEAQKRLLAKRAAELDAMRKLAEMLKGVKVDGRSSVSDFCTQSDRVSTAVAAFLKGIKPVDIVNFPDFTCEVTMQLKVRKLIETIEITAKRSGCWPLRKTTEEVKIDTVAEDKVYEVVGRGAWTAAPEVPATPAAAVEAETKSILTLRRVLGEAVVVE